MPFILQQPEEQTDNWDDDFEEGISLSKLQGVCLRGDVNRVRGMTCFSALEKTSAEEAKQEIEDNAQTIRPGRSPASGPVPLPIAKAPSPGIHPISEDISDFDFEDVDDQPAASASASQVKRARFD